MSLPKPLSQFRNVAFHRLDPTVDEHSGAATEGDRRAVLPGDSGYCASAPEVRTGRYKLNEVRSFLGRSHRVATIGTAPSLRRRLSEIPSEDQ